jgi:L-alanine-DL-glutamate epimerase-like enolase superfamily enzyme
MQLLRNDVMVAPMTFTIPDIHFHVLPMQTRFPFRYGIASMIKLPHLFVTAEMVVDGRPVRGLASEGLAPKWFTKHPETSCEQDVAEMLAVIQNAARIAENAAQQPVGYFGWWRDLYDEQSRWAGLREQPPLLANLGVSLMERAVLDGLCKAAATPLHRLLKSEALGIELSAVRGELKGITLAQVLPEQPLTQVALRHTIGLGDPLHAEESPQLDDGLPDTLADSIRAYGLRYFKIKVTGRAEVDLPRLRVITDVLTAGCPQGFKATLDGNEQFTDLAAFRQFYEALKADAKLTPLFESLLLIEQPLHRDHALKDDVAPALQGWSDGPEMIIDESDGSLADLPRALDLGYSGTSHKSCKGIVKGLANAALLKVRAPQMKRPPILSGEDLANVGPVSVLQDLAMMSALGIPHVERNGHHYFRGLSMYSPEFQAEALRCHPGYYRRHELGFPTLEVQDGLLDMTSVNAAPFGCAIPIDATQFTPLKTWIMSGGMGELG